MIDQAFAEEAARQSLAVNWVSGEYLSDTGTRKAINTALY